MPAGVGAARIATAPMTHWADEVKVPLITTDGAPGSLVERPVRFALACDQLSVCKSPSWPPVGWPCQAWTSMTRSPAALSATVTELFVLLPKAL